MTFVHSESPAAVHHTGGLQAKHRIGKDSRVWLLTSPEDSQKLHWEIKKNSEGEAWRLAQSCLPEADPAHSCQSALTERQM